MLTVTVIAEKLGLKASQVNLFFLDLGFIKKEANGYVLLRQGLGVQRIIEKGSSKSPYVLWHENILENKDFLRVIDSFKNPKKVDIAPIEEKVVISKEVKDLKEPYVKKAFIPDRGKFAAEFRSEDGHFLRSKGEVILDNWLYYHGIMHAYEKRVPIFEAIQSDFYLPKFNIYIELWGYEDKPEYLDRKKVKKDLYKKYGIKLLELSDADIKNIDDIMPIKLLELGAPLI